ncbi:sensor histidine kinase [Arenibacterium sp. CAU 1754]
MTKQADPPVKWWNSLRVRLIAIMSLALLPVGLIAIGQTKAVTENAHRKTELSLLAIVENAALEERLSIHRALGAADTIVALYDQFNTADCSSHMVDIANQSGQFSFAGIVPPDGIVTCSSAGLTYDLSTSPVVQDLLASEKTRVIVNTDAPISKTSVISVSKRIEKDGRFLGVAAVSVPRWSIDTEDAEIPDDGLIDLITFDSSGNVFTTKAEAESLDQRLPQDRPIASLTLARAMAFTSANNAGDELIYTVVPIEDNQLYILGIWDARKAMQAQIGNVVSPTLFPALMWITSLLVVMLAIHRLVLRHIRFLRRQMLRFARDRTLPETSHADEMPNELRDVQSNFISMAYSIMQDEARLEDSIHEKNVLIREIHHRVKNNLQLISSIVNMHIRNTSDPETQSVLHRIQDRVLSLATIHRDLYQTNNAGLVNVGHLVSEIVQKSAEIGVETPGAVRMETQIEDILLYPDQAVPMSLLASEVVTNAMKHARNAEGQTPWIKAEFLAGENRARIFRVSNSSTGAEESGESGMGSKLINAFAIQLGAAIHVEKTDEQYTVTITFDASDFLPEPGNY